MRGVLAAGRWFSPCTPVSSTTKTDRHDIAEILLKVALNTITLTRSDEMYSIQHYVIKYVSDLWQVGGFLRFPLPIELTATI